MLKYIIGLSLLTITCGCSQDGLEKEALDRKIDEIASSVNNGKQRYNSLDNLNDLLSEFRKCKTHDLQTPNKRVRDLICSIQTNPTAKVVFESAAIRTNLQALTSKEERCRLISDWTDALLHIEVDGLSSAARTSSISAALRLLEVDAYWLLRDECSNCRELWDYRFRVLDWLDGHIARMNPENVPLADNENDERQKWWNYLFLVEKRENLIEGWEKVAFDPSAYDSGTDELEGIRCRFEQKIGRSVRKDCAAQDVGAILGEVRKHVNENERMALEAIRMKRNGKPSVHH